jgi:hypothetical protein
MSFTRLLHDRCKRPMDDTEQRLCYKAEGKRWARERGATVPATLQGPATLDDLEHPEGDRWALKPNRGCSGRAIVLAVHHEGAEFRSLMGPQAGGDHPPRSFGGWIEWCRAEMEHYQGKPDVAFPDEWIIEDLRGDGQSVPDSYGVWCVGGSAFFVRQQVFGDHRSGPHTRAATWTSQWVRVHDVVGRRSMRAEADTTPPRHATQMIREAERIARDWPGPFVRVDFLAGSEGPVLIELTPRPAGGRITVTEPWDSAMGEAWEQKKVAYG